MVVSREKIWDLIPTILSGGYLLYKSCEVLVYHFIHKKDTENQEWFHIVTDNTARPRSVNGLDGVTWCSVISLEVKPKSRIVFKIV